MFKNKIYISIILVLLAMVGCEPSADLLVSVPGYDESYSNRAYAGYLKT